MALKSFNNVVVKREVSLAIERIIVAPSTQVWTPGRVTLDNTALPTGFKDLGAVVEDSVNLTTSRELFELQTGLPRVLQYSAVVGVSGLLEFQLHSFSPRRMAYALGNVDPVAEVNTIFTISNTDVPTLTQVVLATTHGIVAGDVIVTSATSPGLLTTDNEAEVTSVSSLTLTLTSPGLLALPSTGWFVSKLKQIAQPFGTSKVKEFHILGVADTIDGFQVVHDLQKARPAAGDMQDAFKPTENGKVQARFQLLGYQTSRYGADTELIVAERFWFPKA